MSINPAALTPVGQGNLADEGITSVDQGAPFPGSPADAQVAPRAVSVAGPIPDPTSAGPSGPGISPDALTPVGEDQQPAFVPPIIANSDFKDGIMAHLHNESSDQGFDDAVQLNMGDLKWPLTAFKGINPDVAAKVDELAKSNGVTYAQADAGKEDLEVLQQAKNIYASLSATDDKGNFIYPNTIKWLQDPANLAKTKDDVTALTAIEEAVKGQNQIGESSWFQTLRSAGAGIQDSLTPLLKIPAIAYNFAAGTFNQTSMDPGPIGQTLNDLSGNNLHGLTLPSAPEWLDTMFGATRALNKNAASYSGATLDGRSFAGDLAKGDYKGAAQTGAVGLATFIPMIAAAAAQPELGVALGAGSSGASQYQTDEEAGKTPDEATGDALVNAGINAAGMKTAGAVGQLERMKALFSVPVANETASQLWGRVARQSFTSAVQGGLTQTAMQGADDAADSASGNKDAFKNEASKLVSSAILGFIADGSISAPLGAIEGLRQIRQQQVGQDWWTRVNGAVGQSKLTQRDPNGQAQFLGQNLDAAGAPSTVGVDADKLTTFFQNRPAGDLNKFAADMGLKPEDITNAAATGGAVDLPIAQYIPKYGGSDLDAAINQDLRFTPGGLSANETKAVFEQVQQTQASIKAELEKTVAGQDGAELPTQIRTMRDTLMADKKEGGMGYSADQADSQLAVLMAGLRHIAAGRGETVGATIDRLGLELDTKSQVAENPSGTVSVRNQGGTDGEREAKRAALRAQEPVKVDTKPFDTVADQKQLRAVAETEFKKQKALGPVTTTDGREVKFSSGGIGKSLSHIGDARVARIVPGIRDLLSRAVPLWSEAPRREDSNTKAFHNYAAKAELDGKNVYAHLRVREDANGHFHYDHDVSSVEEIENPNSQQAGHSGDQQAVSSSLVPNQEANAAADKNKLRAWWHEVNSPDVRNQGERGAISFGNGKTVIHLFKTADLSTLLHETGHLFLHEMQGMLDQGHGGEQVRADLQTLHDFAGVKAGEALSRDGEEKIVNAFESYLRDGKAPSVELAGPFARFRMWLTNIYRSVTALGTQPTDAVKQVFDRMLASEDDIAHAQEYYSRKGDVLNLIKADEAEKEPVRAKLAKVQQTELDKQTSAYLKSYLKAIGGVSAVRSAAKEAVDKQPIYQALDTAKDGKIDEDLLRDEIGTKAFKEFTEKFPNLVKKNGEHTLESLAAQHGFESPESLADNLVAAVPKGEAAKNYTQRLVAEKEQQLRDEITKQGATPADGVMHTDSSLAYLIAETNLMAKQLSHGKPRPLEAAVYRDAAKQAIGDMQVRKAVRYSDFAKTEARLAKQVLDLAKRGQWQDALDARKKQLAQHAMVQEAIKARDEVDVIARRYSPSRLKGKLDKVENQYLDPIKEILSRYGLSADKPASPFDLQRINDLDSVLFSQIPTWVVRGENTLPPNQDYRSLSFGQLQDVDASARAVIEFGIDTLKSNLAAEEKTVAELTQKALETISKLRTRERRQIGGNGIVDTSKNAWAKAVKAFDIAGSHLTKFQFAARWLDFFGRSVHTRIFDEIRDAEKTQGDAQDAFYKLAEPHLDALAKATDRLRKERGTRFAVDGVEKPAAYAEDGEKNWSPEELVAYMMNTGSEGNIAALKNSFDHGTAEFDRVAQLFSGKELRAMDGLRKSLDSLFPGLDETNFKLYNRHVDKVDAVPQDLTDKEGKPVRLEGGYWPLMFNRRVNDRRGLGSNNDADVLEDQTRAMIRAARPQDGFTKSRSVGHSLAPRLDMGVLTDHVDNVTRFTHLAPVIRDANRMMTAPAWRQAVTDKLGEAEYKQMIDWLRYQANPGRKQSDDLNSGIDRMVARIRTLGTKSAMGLNVLSFFKWRTALVNGAVALGGWKWLARGYGDAGLRGLSTSTIGLTSNDLWKEMVQKSNVLGPRESHGARDLVSDVAKMKWNETKFRLPFTAREITTHDLKGVLYTFAKAGDRAVVFPVWRGAYIKYMETMADPNMTDEERDKSAVTYADDIVQSSQPTSMNVDLSSLTRSGSELAKLLTMFTTYPVTLSNRFRGHYEAYRNGADSLPKFASNMLQEGAMEPMARAFITAAWYGTVPTALTLAIAPMTNAIETLPGMGPLFNSVTKDDATELSPALDWFKLEENLRNDWKAHKSATQIAWDIGRLAGYVTGIPIANVVKPLLNWISWSYGERSTFK